MCLCIVALYIRVVWLLQYKKKLVSRWLRLNPLLYGYNIWLNLFVCFFVYLVGMTLGRKVFLYR